MRLFQHSRFTRLQRRAIRFYSNRRRLEVKVRPCLRVREYETRHPSPAGSSGWYVPSYKELEFIYAEKDLLNVQLSKIIRSPNTGGSALVDHGRRIPLCIHNRFHQRQQRSYCKIYASRQKYTLHFGCLIEPSGRIRNQYKQIQLIIIMPSLPDFQYLQGLKQE